MRNATTEPKVKKLTIPIDHETMIFLKKLALDQDRRLVDIGKEMVDDYLKKVRENKKD
jgi:hypothetical protein